MKDLKGLCIGVNINQKQNQKKLIKTILQDFLLMVLFKELIDCLLLLLITLLRMIMKFQLAILLIDFKEAVIKILSRVDITNCNVLIDVRNFYDQPINDQVKTSDEIRKIATGKGDDYTTGCLLNYQHFKHHYQLITVDLVNKNN